MGNLLISLLNDKCPFCEEEKIFKEKTSVLHLPVMYDNCKQCGKDLNGEPGYFFGAMYISYGLSVALNIAAFVICRVILEMPSLELIIAIMAVLTILSSYKIFKLSRILWLKIFPPGKGTNFIGGGDL